MIHTPQPLLTTPQHAELIGLSARISRPTDQRGFSAEAAWAQSIRLWSTPLRDLNSEDHDVPPFQHVTAMMA
jgi:hypothetical protein